MTPSIRIRRVVPPAPGKMPTRISGRPILAFGLSAAKRRWQIRPSSSPMPAAVPGVAQAIGLPPFLVLKSIPASSIFRISLWVSMIMLNMPSAGFWPDASASARA